LAAVKATPHGDAEVHVNMYNPKEFVDLKDGYFEFKLYLKRAHFHGALSIPVQLDLTWESTESQAKIKVENEKRMAEFVAQQKRAYEEAYVKAARERITAASKIVPRRYEDLRQEERIAVYRRLIKSLAPASNPKAAKALFAGIEVSYPICPIKRGTRGPRFSTGSSILKKCSTSSRPSGGSRALALRRRWAPRPSCSIPQGM
jgi:hypothetical protein